MFGLPDFSKPRKMCTLWKSLHQRRALERSQLVGQRMALSHAPVRRLLLTLLSLSSLGLLVPQAAAAGLMSRVAVHQLAVEPRNWVEALGAGMAAANTGRGGATLAARLQWEDLGLQDVTPPPVSVADGSWPLSAGESATASMLAPEHLMMQQVMGAVNAAYDSAAPPKQLEDGNDLQRSTLKAVGVWWSNPGRVLELSTVAVTATVSRLPQLYSQCRTWPGPLSVALYQPLISADGSGKLSPANQVVLRSAVLQVCYGCGGGVGQHGATTSCT